MDGPLAARIAGLIVAATATDVCFVHVLDDGGSALTLTGVNPQTPPFDAAVGRVRLLLGEGVTGWVASHGQPVTITDHKEADPRYRYFPTSRRRVHLDGVGADRSRPSDWRGC